MSAVFVHVSDIHFGQEKDDRVQIHGDVKQQLILDAKEVVSKIPGGAAHGILVTGDIAQSGVKAEYDEAAKWLDELAGSIGVGIDCVQMVPGNHDLDRSKLTAGVRLILDRIRDGGAAEFGEFLNDASIREALFARFKDYGSFSFGYNCPLNNDGVYASEMVVTLAPGRAIRFIRLNSSLLCHGKERDEHPELMIGARQFTIPREDGVENIILVHHPLGWYKDREQVQTYVRNRARVFISGHEHDPKVSVDSVEPGCDLMMLAAGATVPFKSNAEYTFTYNVIEFDWDAETDSLSVTIHPRAWNPERTQFEADDQRLGGANPNYRLGCPSFRKAKRPDVPSVQHTSSMPPGEQASCSAGPTIEMVPMASSVEELKLMPPPLEGYEVVRLRFFRDLLEGERLRILVELDAVPEDLDEPMSQGLERKLLEWLAREGKLEQVEHMIDRLIRERKDGMQ
ncbi:Calcineurin-like phosphoesterase [Pseudomonas sp. UC 17F4]|uniref:metallophosphoesterase n=1 Tax=Pseudomonas sp. UC 17F4 TaxID=1855328 RepID=UPI00087F2364|nr:metallophosphoesterase [Pseudomonas sp. UC 17F4]SDQ38449.1 Calcineurin-like phosphoesterase [Pseudomonas sp. UC 17F4]